MTKPKDKSLPFADLEAAMKPLEELQRDERMDFYIPAKIYNNPNFPALAQELGIDLVAKGRKQSTESANPLDSILRNYFVVDNRLQPKLKSEIQAYLYNETLELLKDELESWYGQGTMRLEHRVHGDTLRRLRAKAKAKWGGKG